ncbi:MAG: helix-turn-helix domain-containing protein [bacterium]
MLKSNKINWITMADPVIVQKIGLCLKQMRLDRNISQEDLAERTGLNRITVSRLEAGRAATLLTVVQVLRGLDKLDILDVFEEKSELSPLQLLKMQKKERQRASRIKKKNTAPSENMQW